MEKKYKILSKKVARFKKNIYLCTRNSEMIADMMVP